MPFTINGIGTSYYGKSNLDARHGTCESCGFTGDLQSYETGHYFTFVFIPVIPLGKKQIIDFCPSCSRHRVCDPAEWKRAQDETINQAGAELLANRNDPEAAIRMHATLFAFHKRDEAAELAAGMASDFGDNIDVLLYLGGWEAQHGDNQQADLYFEKALVLDPQNPHAKRAVAIGRIEQGKLAEARQLLRAIEPPSPHYDPLPFFILAKAHQDRHEHQQALELFHFTLRHSPELGKDKTFRKWVRASESALGVEKSLVKKESVLASPLVWITAIALLIVGLLCGAWYYIGQNRNVHIVNGLPQPIVVSIDDGPPLTIHSGGKQNLTLAEGGHKCKVTSPAVLAEEFDFHLQASKAWRFFNSPAFVLDPSQSAVVVWEQTVYRENPREDDAENKGVVHLGERLTTYEDVDYVFEPFPAQLKVDSKRARKVKTRISQETGFPPTVIVLSEQNNLTPQQQLAYLERFVLTEPSPDQDLLGTYVGLCAGQDQLPRAQSTLEKRLAERPVPLELHRTYQWVGEQLGSAEQLVSRYNQLLAGEPDNADLVYLRGRLETNSNRAIEFYDRALKIQPEHSYALSAKGYQLLCRGNLPAAKQAYAKAVEIDPQRFDVADSLFETRLALGEGEALRPEIEAKIAEYAGNITAAIQMVDTYLVKENIEEAVNWSNQFRENIPPEVAQFPTAILRLDGVLAYARQDWQAVREVGKETGEPGMQSYAEFVAFVSSGELHQAGESLQNLAAQEGFKRLEPAQLALCLAYALQGEKEHADIWKAKVIEQYQTLGGTERLAAELLERGISNEEQVQQAIGLALVPEEKRTLLLVLAAAASAGQNELIDLAATLNYNRRFPYYLVSTGIEQLRGK